ncbi:MAG: hypothetical protein IT529_19240 [Burkholderiales bacterium]|nr:hypothetical protein [Burkholderiales bacterium]
MKNALTEALAEAGVDFVCVFPSSGMSATQKEIDGDPRFTCIYPSNEGEGAAICAGAWLAGKRPALLMENSGMLLSAYQLMRLNAAYDVPLLMVLDHRGGPGEGNWWAMPLGWSMTPVLDALRVPWLMADTAADVATFVPRLVRSMLHSKYPVALILRRGIGLER